MTKTWLGFAVIAMLASGGANAQQGRGGNTNTNGSITGINEDDLEAPAVPPAPVAIVPPSAPPRSVAGSPGHPGPRSTAATRASTRPLPVAPPAAPPVATHAAAATPSAEAPDRRPLQAGAGSSNMNTNGSLMGVDDSELR